MRRNTVLKVGLALVIVALAAGGLWRYMRAASSESAAAAAPEPSRSEPNVLRLPSGSPQLSSIRVAPAAESPLPLAEPLNGRVAYDENRTVRVSSPIAGRVTKLTLLPGDPVRRGEVLVELDSPELAAAGADLAKAEADERRARLALERVRTLVDGGVAPRKDLEGAEAEHAQAAAETNRARLRLRNLGAVAKTGGAGFVLRAPSDGVISERRVNPGMEVRPDFADPLFVVTDPTHLWVLVDLPERNLAKVQRGHAALIEVDAYPDLPFKALVDRIGETVDPATRRVQVRLTIDNPDRRLKPEMYARVTLVADAARQAVRVPNSSLITEGLYSYVFVESGPGVYHRRRIEPLVQDREWTYVSVGVGAGEKVVVTGALLLNSELSSTQP